MTKISEMIKHFETNLGKDQIDSYFKDQYALRKICDLKTMIKAIGDVELSDETIKTYLFELFNEKRSQDSKTIDKIRTIYDLSKDTDISSRDLTTLFFRYNEGVYKFKFDDIKTLIDTKSDLSKGIYMLQEEAFKYGEEESKKLEFLKEDYHKLSIDRIQSIVKKRMISSDKVLEMFPSKEFIEKSKVRLPLHYDTYTGLDLVFKRLSSDQFEEYYQELDSDELIKLGYCSTGDPVLSTFTKSEYEKDIKQKQLIKR